MYDITQPTTFEELKDYPSVILSNRSDPFIPILLVGNKSDLEKRRKITTKQIDEVAKTFLLDSGCEWMEISTKSETKVS
jgi:GTPase SAR1 family protein